MGDCSRSNTGELDLISISFGLHLTISHSFGDISVILALRGCSLGISGFPSSKSRLLTCFIGNMELLCTQCRGIGPHLSLSGKSHGFSQFAVGTWVYSRFMVGMAIQNSCLFTEVRTPV